MNTDPRRLKNSMNDGCFVVSDSIPKAVYPILNALAFAAIQLRGTLMRGHFDSSVDLPLGQNSDGDSQVPMDIYADRLFHEVLKDQDVAWYASEEREEVAAMRKAGRYAVAIDPLDGSSNVNINISVGSIFPVSCRNYGRKELFKACKRSNCGWIFYLWAADMAYADLWKWCDVLYF